MGVSKYSNEMKSLCIDNNVVEVVRQFKKDIYHNEDGERLIQFLESLSRDEYLDCSNRLLESAYRKYARAREHIKNLVLQGGAIFITLTFTNEVLAKTSAKTRRKYVARYLKSQGSFYVANIDYSPTKEREHYHAVIDSRCNRQEWKYGFVWCESVRTQDFNANRIARYVAKLTSHAFKVNATRLIYSRNAVI